MQLEHIFAGERIWRGEIEREPAVQHFAGGVAKDPQRCKARLGNIAEHAGGNGRNQTAGHSNHSDATATRRRCDSRDGVGVAGPGGHRRISLSLLSAATSLLMRHC